jgi:hypothetical protein
LTPPWPSSRSPRVPAGEFAPEKAVFAPGIQGFVGKLDYLGQESEMMRKNVESPLDTTVDTHLQGT